MNHRSPAFQFYPDKWQSHTRRLSDNAYRVYHELLCWMWQHAANHCSIDANPEAVACAVAMPLAAVQAALKEIQNPVSPLLKLRYQKLISRGLKKEAEKQAKRRDSARASISARWNRVKRYERNTNEPFLSYSPTPTPTPTPYEEKREREEGRFLPRIKALREGHFDFRSVPDHNIAQALLTQPDESKWDAAIADLCHKNAGASIRAPIALLEKYLADKPAADVAARAKRRPVLISSVT